MCTPLDKQPRSPSEGELSDINEESGCGEVDDHVPEERDPREILHSKETLGDIS